MAIIDTHRRASQRQVDLMRKATVAQRFAAVRSLTSTVASLSRRALRRCAPDASDEEIGLAFVALHYGEELAHKVRARLDERR